MSIVNDFCFTENVISITYVVNRYIASCNIVYSAYCYQDVSWWGLLLSAFRTGLLWVNMLPGNRAE